ARRRQGFTVRVITSWPTCRSIRLAAASSSLSEWSGWPNVLSLHGVLSLALRCFDNFYLRDETALENFIAPQFALQQAEHFFRTISADSVFRFAQTLC